MFEIIKIIAEKVFESIDIVKLIELKKKKGKDAIGTELFLLYSSLNQIYVVGLRIVGEIESAIAWMESKKSHGELDRRYMTPLRQMLLMQKDNLLGFLSAFATLSREMQVINPKAFRELHAFVYPKTGIIDALIKLLETNSSEAPLFFIEPDTVKRLSGLTSVRGEGIQGELNILAMRANNSTEPTIGREYARDARKHQEISDIGHIEVVHLDLLHSYLDTRNPRKQIESLEAILDKLYQAIKDNFEMTDILLGVGDQRAGSVDRLAHWDLAHQIRQMKDDAP